MDNVTVPTPKRRSSVIIGALASGAALLILGALVFSNVIDLDPNSRRARKLLKLNRDDYQHILAECRQLLANKATHGNAQHSTITVEESEWPANIRSLNPNGVHIEDNRVGVVFSSGKHFCGLWAYADGISHSTSERDAYLHTLEITKGLWLWEEADGYELLKWAK